MNMYLTLFLCIAAVSHISFASANMLKEPGGAILKVFMTQNDKAGIHAVIKGKILSFSTYDKIDREDIVQQAQEKTKVTVRLYDSAGIKKDDILYVVNEKNLIISKIKVEQLFKSKSLGYLLVGRGNFTFASHNHRVIQTVVDLNSQNAFLHKTRGDYYLNRGERDNAIKEYKTSLSLDRGYPEAHFSLGMIYFEDNLYQIASSEFSAAYNNIHRMKDNYEKYQLLKGLIQIRIHDIYDSPILKSMNRKKRDDLQAKYKKEALVYCRYAHELYPDSGHIYFFFGKLNYVKSDAPHESDAATKNYFLKAVKADPGLVEAYIHLAILYYRNGNSLKGMDFIEQAIKVDPANPRAREIKKYINRYPK